MDADAAAALVRGIMQQLPAGARMRAVLEQPVPSLLNGKLSWLSAGLSYGVWQGVLNSFDVEIQVRRRI